MSEVMHLTFDVQIDAAENYCMHDRLVTTPKEMR